MGIANQLIRDAGINLQGAALRVPMNAQPERRLIMAVTTQQEKAREVAGKIGEAAAGAVETATRMAGDAAAFIGRKADSATSAVGTGMKSVAGTIESGGRYLEEHSLREIGSDFTDLIRRNPIPSLLIAVGLGFLLARAIRG
jgi:hypothetical protein